MNIPHEPIDRRALGHKDYCLYRLSLKGLVVNDKREVLVVKETGRDWWDLPGGGMEHGESVKDALARELAEEVNMHGDFDYRVICVDEPGLLKRADIWQIRLVFQVTPSNFEFSAGEDGDEVAFKNPNLFKDSESDGERLIYEYCSSRRLVRSMN